MKALLLSIVLSGFVFAACEKDKADPEIEKMSAVRGYANWFIDDFRCGLYVPENYNGSKSYPLIIYLHGHTDTTTWNLGWYNEPILSKDPCIVLTPECPEEEIYGWGSSYDPRISPMMAKTFEMIDRTEKAFNLDEDRYYIYGISMGGYGTYGVIQKYPGMFAAGYVECGAGSIDIAPVLSEIPFWIFHGSEDPVVPVEAARNLYQAVLNNGGLQIRYTEYEGVSHNTWDFVRYETTLPWWLLAQHRGSVHQEPGIVNGFKGELYEGGKVGLQWEIPTESWPPTDNNIWYCRIYRDNVVVSEVYNNLNSFIDSALVTGNTYAYRISAVNYFFRESKLSDPVNVVVME